MIHVEKQRINSEIQQQVICEKLSSNFKINNLECFKSASTKFLSLIGETDYLRSTTLFFRRFLINHSFLTWKLKTKSILLKRHQIRSNPSEKKSFR